MATAGAPKRILVVDDDESIRDLFQFSLKAEGFDVETAEDGQAGLDKVSSYKPDLIVLDLMMPRLNGFDVVHRLQTPETVKIPIIVVTGFSEQANEHIIQKEPNVAGLLIKPVRLKELSRQIHSLLGA